jgi:flagellar hook-associated protein 1 FlgK
MSLSQALNSAVAGLATTQAGMSTVAANVANAQTPGYVRKTVEQVTTSAGGAGASVRVEGINRELDQFLQRQLQTESSGGAYADLKTQFYNQLQQVYGTPGSATSIDSIYNIFTSALQALSTTPNDTSAQAGVISSAQVLAQQLNTLTNSVQGLRSDAETGLSDAVRNANDDLQGIAKINQQLSTSQPNDASTATLLDQRDNYINQLSQLMDIKVTNGASNQVSVFTNSGIQLVGTQAATLNFDAQGTMTANAQWSSDPSQRNVGTITLVSPTGASMDLIANKSIRSGQIAGYLEMRDQVLVQAQNQLDQMAAGISSALSDQTVPGTAVTLGASSGFDVDIGNMQNGNSINVTYTDTATGKQHQIQIVRVDDASALPLPPSGNPNVKVIGVDFSGGMSSVVNQLDTAFKGKPAFSNPSGTTLEVLNDGGANTISINSVSATSTMTSLSGGKPQMPFFLDGTAAYTGVISGNGSQATGLAGRITVNAALVADPSKLVSYQAGTPSGDSTRPSFLYNQLTSAPQSYSPASGIGTALAPYSGSIPSFIQQVLSQQGDAADAASQLSQGQDMVVNSLQQRFNSESGVNIDEEMSNLLTLQNAYAANARVLTTIKDMFDTLMQM